MAVLRIQVLSARMRMTSRAGCPSATPRRRFFDRVQAEYEQIAPHRDGQPGPMTIREPMPDRDDAEPG